MQKFSLGLINVNTWSLCDTVNLVEVVFSSLCSCIHISFAVLECMVSEQYYTGCGLWVTQFHLLKKVRGGCF